MIAVYISITGSWKMEKINESPLQSGEEEVGLCCYEGYLGKGAQNHCNNMGSNP